MERRGFLGAMLAAAAAPAFVRAGVLMPVKQAIWVPETDLAARMASNLARSSILTPAIIAAECLKILERQLDFTASLNRDYASWDDLRKSGVTHIKRPTKYLRKP